MSLEKIARGEHEVVRAMATGDVALWRTLLEDLARKVHAGSGNATPASNSFVEVMLAVEPSVEAWCRTASKAADAAQSPWFSTNVAASRLYLPWLLEGVCAAREKTDAAALEARYVAL